MPTWEDISNTEFYSSLPLEKKRIVASNFDKKFGGNTASRYLDDEDGYTLSNLGTDIKDIGVSILKGGAEIPSVVGQGADFLGADKLGGKLKEIGKEGTEYWEGKLSDRAKEAQEKPFLSDEKGEWFTDTALRKLFLTAGESSLGMAAMAPIGVAGKGAATAVKFTPRLAKTLTGLGVKGPRATKLAEYATNLLAFGGAEAAYSGLQNAAQMGDMVSTASHEELLKSPAYRDLLETNQSKGKLKCH